MAGQSDPDFSVFSAAEVFPQTITVVCLAPFLTCLLCQLLIAPICSQMHGFKQMEFLAEDEMIEIVPNMRMEELNLISVLGSSSPFDFMVLVLSSCLKAVGGVI